MLNIQEKKNPWTKIAIIIKIQGWTLKIQIAYLTLLKLDSKARIKIARTVTDQLRYLNFTDLDWKGKGYLYFRDKSFEKLATRN